MKKNDTYDLIFTTAGYPK